MQNTPHITPSTCRVYKQCALQEINVKLQEVNSQANAFCYLRIVTPALLCNVKCLFPPSQQLHNAFFVLCCFNVAKTHKSVFIVYVIMHVSTNVQIDLIKWCLNSHLNCRGKLKQGTWNLLNSVNLFKSKHLTQTSS